MRWTRNAVLLLALGAVITVAHYRFIPVWATPLMLIRTLEGHPPARVAKRWAPLDAISPALQRAVIAAEDQRFCTHWGFDWRALRKVIERNEDRGASTITQQTAKNVFLWPGRSWLRKGMEAGYALLIEAMWPKERILEVYLNVVEFGPGVYGAEAAARTYFGRSAAELSGRQAALMAAVLPNPLERSPARPSGYVAGRASHIQGQMRNIRVAGDFGLCPPEGEK